MKLKKLAYVVLGLGLLGGCYFFISRYNFISKKPPQYSRLTCIQLNNGKKDCNYIQTKNKDFYWKAIESGQELELVSVNLNNIDARTNGEDANIYVQDKKLPYNSGKTLSSGCLSFGDIGIICDVIQSDESEKLGVFYSLQIDSEQQNVRGITRFNKNCLRINGNLNDPTQVRLENICAKSVEEKIEDNGSSANIKGLRTSL